METPVEDEAWSVQAVTMAAVWRVGHHTHSSGEKPGSPCARREWQAGLCSECSRLAPAHQVSHQEGSAWAVTCPHGMNVPSWTRESGADVTDLRGLGLGALRNPREEPAAGKAGGGWSPCRGSGVLGGRQAFPGSPGGHSVPGGGQSRRRIQVSQLLARVGVTCERVSELQGLTNQWLLFFRWEGGLFPGTRET